MNPLVHASYLEVDIEPKYMKRKMSWYRHAFFKAL